MLLKSFCTSLCFALFACFAIEAVEAAEFATHDPEPDPSELWTDVYR